MSESGSDWQTFRLQDLSTGEDVPDPAITTKFCAAEWLPDGRSFAYLDFGHAGDDGTGTGALRGGRLKLHRIGQPTEQDDLILEFPENDQIFAVAQVIGDDRYVAVTITEGTDSRNRLWVYPLDHGRGRTVARRSDQDHRRAGGRDRCRSSWSTTGSTWKPIWTLPAAASCGPT